MTPSAFTPAERIESLKVAIAGGVCAGAISFGIVVVNRILALGLETITLTISSSMASLTLLVSTGIVGLSGALFALVYRYSIRQDKNRQLNSGVVLAFTLVRGLALVDTGSAIAQNGWPFLSACGESLLIFGLTAITLSFGIQQRWLKTFS